MMWQHHFEFLLLGYGAYLTFAEFVRAARCRTSPTSTSRRWWPASTWCCSAPTPSCAGWRGWRSRPAWTARSSRAARPPRSTPSWPAATRAARWLDELEQIKDPWFNMGTGDGLYHYYGSWHDDPSIPYASLVGHIAALKAGQRDRAPDRGAREGARPAGGGVRRAARRGARAGVPGAARALAHGLPVRRGAQVLLRLLVPVALLQQGARVRRAAREARLHRGRRGRLPPLPPRGDAGARGAVADTGRPAARRSGRTTGRRSWRAARSCSSELAEWTPPPALGAMPEAVNDPIVGDALGDHARSASRSGRARRRATS